MGTQFTRRDFIRTATASLGAAALGAAWPTTGSAESTAAAALGVSQLPVPHPARVRILQLTDLHFFAGGPNEESVNAVTRETIRTLTKETKPDLVFATGDLWPENRGGMGDTYMRHVVEEFEALDVPWAYVWGNHDQLADFSVGHEAFEKARNSLYRGAASDGNYVIDLVDKRDRRVWQFVCLNTHRTGLHMSPELQQSLAASNVPPVPCFAFFHIPLKQYATIWDNGAATGVLAERPCSEEEDGSALPKLKSLGVRACFCGHDHVNDYSGVEDGVELVYGRASGAGGYGVEILAKGGKLIDLDCEAKSFSWASVTPDGQKWVPKPGEHADRSAERKK